MNAELSIFNVERYQVHATYELYRLPLLLLYVFCSTAVSLFLREELYRLPARCFILHARDMIIWSQPANIYAARQCISLGPHCSNGLISFQGGGNIARQRSVLANETRYVRKIRYCRVNFDSQACTGSNEELESDV